ncbi:unnamed protein product, partial [Linum tenue]
PHRRIRILPPFSTPLQFASEHLQIQLYRNRTRSMVTCFPSSPKKLGMTAALFSAAAAIMGYAAHLSYVNVAPQQARTRARDEFVKERMRQRHGYGK